MKADRGTGQEHSRYTPTCVSIFTNKIDEVKFERVLQEKIAEQEETMSAEEMKRFAHSLRLSEGKDTFILMNMENLIYSNLLLKVMVEFLHKLFYINLYLF